MKKTEPNNNKQNLLYLISCYTNKNEYKSNRWIQKTHLQVLIFEAILQKIFTWDYSPTLLESNQDRLFFNISQEGERDIYDLVNNDFLNNLKLTTSECSDLICFQVNAKAILYSEHLQPDEKAKIDQLLQCPSCKQLIEISKEKQTFFLRCPSENCKYFKKSSVTHLEDVSYFCKPYFPTITTAPCVSKEVTEKRLKNYLTQQPKHNIHHTLNHNVFLSKTKLLIGEWLPFGHNQIAALNYKINLPDVEQSIKFTQDNEFSQDSMIIETPESLTSVKVLDTNFASYINFEAYSQLPENPEIVQIEEFAVHINHTGQIRYGLEIIAVNKQIGDLTTLDYLPRILFDIEQSSTSIMNTLLTAYQKKLMDVTFNNKFRNRYKYDFVIAEDIYFAKDREIQKDLTFEEKLKNLQENTAHKSEIRQVLDNIEQIILLDKSNATLVVGTKGAIFIGKHEKYERFIVDFLFVMSIEVFLDHFFTRLFLLNDQLENVRNLSKTCQIHPENLGELQQKISQLRNDTILLEEVRFSLQSSLEAFWKRLAKYTENTSHAEIYKKFKFREKISILNIRVQELQKMIAGVQKHLDGLNSIAEVVNQKQLRYLQESLSQNTKSLEEVTKSNDRSNMSLKVLEIIMAGGIAFSIMNQLTGEWQISEGNSFKNFLQSIFNIPGAWLFVTLMFWFSLVLVLFWYIGKVQKAHSRIVTSRVNLNIPYCQEALAKLIECNSIHIYSCDTNQENCIVYLSWKDNNKEYWKGNKPTIEICYDKQKLIFVTVEISCPNNITPQEAEELLMKRLQNFGIINKDEML